MGKVTVHAGDWGECSASFSSSGSFGFFTFPHGNKAGDIGKTGHDIASVEKANEESVKRIGGTVGWGAVGGVLLGPVGLLAGGRGTDVTFVAHFKDGSKLLATTDAKTYTAIQAASF
jgi:hypothetical protein